MEEWRREFPVGMSVAQVEKGALGKGVPYTLSEPRKCEENAWAADAPHRSRGGACMVALERVGTTWYGLETAIQIRLMFDRSGVLVERGLRQQHTFL